MKDLDFYINMYKDYLQVESREELNKHLFWLKDKLWNKGNDLNLFQIMGIGIFDESRFKLQNEINDLQIQIKAIKEVLKENGDNE